MHEADLCQALPLAFGVGFHSTMQCHAEMSELAEVPEAAEHNETTAQHSMMEESEQPG